MPGLDDLMNEVTSRARQIADGGDASELGVEIWALTMDRFDEEGQCVATPLHTIFGCLTDPVDWPGKEPEVPAAESQIRRAAQDWLALSNDREGVNRFLDRWLFDEFGWGRPWICFMDDDGRMRVLEFDGAATLRDPGPGELD